MFVKTIGYQRKCQLNGNEVKRGSKETKKKPLTPKISGSLKFAKQSFYRGNTENLQSPEKGKSRNFLPPEFLRE